MKESGREPFVIGVLGGMGTYATIDLFKKYAKVFPAVKEWDRPRLIIDNNCTMPSRVRACLYGENVKELVAQMAASIRILLDAGATHIILACNTSHLFLDEVYKLVPQARQRVCNIIDACVAELVREKVSSVYLLATEGTILSKVYNNKLAAQGISCQAPSQPVFAALRQCIEAVKQDSYTAETLELFRGFLQRPGACILGCTELPVLYDMCYPHAESTCKVYDPLLLTLANIKRQFDGYNM